MNSASKPALLPPNFPPAVVVHSRAQAEFVLSFGQPATLLSARGAALAAGVGWWQALVRQAQATWPKTRCLDILDCADAPGMAMAALRLAQQNLVLSADCPAFETLVAAAAQQNAQVLPMAPPALDMARRGTKRLLTQHLGAEAQQLVNSADRDRSDTLR